MPNIFETIRAFIGLEDTPSNYIGQAGKSVVVNPTEDGLEFGPGGGSDAELIVCVNFLDTGAYDFIAPRAMQVDTTATSNAETVTLLLDTLPYTLGDPIASGQVLNIEPTGITLATLNSTKL